MVIGRNRALGWIERTVILDVPYYLGSNNPYIHSPVPSR